MSDTDLRIAAWLLTYALHSTVLLAAAALLTARWVRGEAWRETLWKAALLGGLVTASVQTAGWMVDGLGRWELFVLRSTDAQAAPASESAAPAVVSPASASNEATSPIAAAPAIDHTPAPSQSPAPVVPAAEVSRAAETASPTSAPQPAPSSPRPLVEWALLAWAAGAAAMLARLAWRQLRLRRLLHGRVAVSDEGVLAMLAALRRNAGIWRPVRLTVCPASPTPLALGSGEICVPPRFLSDLDPDQQRSALAHELAHLARRDPAWHFGVSILESIFFFQPLNRMGRARLRESAEFLCDAWAARQTGSPLGLARCLAEVASWMAPGRHPIPAGTMAMAEGGSPLVQRVQRLTAWRGEPREGSPALRIAAAALLIGAVAVVAPAVASTDGKRRERTQAPAESARRVTDGDGQEIVVIRHPDVSQPLARRWDWAVEQIGERGMERAWIAYSVPTRLEPGDAWFTDTDELSMSSFNLSPLNRLLAAPAEHAVLFFAVARNGDVKRVAGRQGVGMEVGGRPVVWLGPAAGAESFAQLRRLADGLGDSDLRESLTGIIGIHPGDETVPYLAAVLGRDGSSGVRSEAAEALGLHPTAEALAALRTAVQRDGSADVRRDAVEAIGEMRTEPAAALLRELAARGRDTGIRRQAVESLGRFPGESTLEALTAVAFGDRDAQVAREAVEAMEHVPAGLGGPVLVRIAWTHADADVARQAAESLGRLPAPWSVIQLDSIARTHPDESVAKEAIEAMGEHPDAVSGRYLRQIARTHPDPAIREEAEDQLRREDRDQDVADEALDHLRGVDLQRALGGGALDALRNGIGGDPDAGTDSDAGADDHDPELDVQLDPDDDHDPDPDPALEVAAALRETAAASAAARTGGARP
jgi:beta-lactamase regulating signal transducer with metallopeptidase domain/HEAT repeat protein